MDDELEIVWKEGSYFEALSGRMPAGTEENQSFPATVW